MRHPHKSHSRADSYFRSDGTFMLGDNDKKLCEELIKGGPVHRKFLRQIQVSMDVSGSLNFWKQFDQYKVGTTTNSESTMHRLAKDPITLECFSIKNPSTQFENFIDYLEMERKTYLLSKNKDTWDNLVDSLPSSWIQKRTWTGSMETILEVIKWRQTHKLLEWREMCPILLKNHIIKFFYELT